ncbi:prominin-1-A-like [Mytilus californianus]|uniref:prominin-1-A-like n=1 Tax=Mytilus californianus TaxID=6549 RepID=UPI00224816BC|nr:prominin-1-A-like [Mytilus californianus]
MSILILRVLLIQGLTCLNLVKSGNITDIYGNVAYGNGTISWENIPSGFSYKTVNNYDPGGLDGLYKMARGFINMIQPDPFPYDIVKDVLRSRFDITTQYQEVINASMGFGICFGIGLLFIIIFPICGCCFCCCRCCGNCRPDLKQMNKANEKCKITGLSSALMVMSVLIASSAVCVLITNDKFTDAINYADSAIANNLDDIDTYINNTVTEFNYVAVDMYEIVNDALTADINGMGQIMADDLMASLNITPVLDAVLELDNSLQAIKTSLDYAVGNITELQTAANTLTSDMNTLSQDIVSTQSGCQSKCASDCDAFDSSVLAVSIDFSGLPDLSNTQKSINDVANENLTDLANSVQSQFDNLDSTINSSTVSARDSIKSTLDSFKSTLNTMVDDFENQIQGAVDTSNLKSDVTNILTLAKNYDKYRQLFSYPLLSIYALIPVLTICGLLIGYFCRTPGVKPTERPFCSCCGGNLIMAAIGIMFMIGSLLMLLTSLTFITGGPMEKMCQSFEDLTVFRDFVDDNGIPDFHFGDVLLNDPNTTISIYNLMVGCRTNQAVFTLLHLDKLIKVDEYLNYTQYLGNIESEIASISSSIDISNYEILSKDLEDALNSFATSGLDGINFTQINDTLNQTITTFNMTSVISTLTTIESQCIDPTKAKWTTHIADAETLRNVTIPAVTTAQSNLQASISVLEGLVNTGITDKINEVLITARNADDQIQNNMTSIISQTADDFKNQLLSYIDSYIDQVRYLIYNELAACLPIWNLWDSLTTTFCNYAIDPLNGFWFALGWGLFFCIPLTIVGIKLSNYYRRLKYKPEPRKRHDDEPPPPYTEKIERYEDAGTKNQIAPIEIISFYEKNHNKIIDRDMDYWPIFRHRSNKVFPMYPTMD